MSVYGSTYLVGQYEREQAASNQPNETSKTMDQDAFLTLLVAQLTNQDPMNPMDDKEMTGQLAQFSSLEMLTNINTNIKALSEDNGTSDLLNATSFIGKTVKASGYTLSKEGDSTSTIYYGLGEAVSNLRINIYDEDGGLVRSEELGSRSTGSYEYSWDGKDEDGTKVPDGTYSVAIVAEDTSGEPVLVQTEISGMVSGVVTENGVQYLRLKDGRYVNMLNVTEIVHDDSGSGTGDGGEDGADSDV